MFDKTRMKHGGANNCTIFLQNDLQTEKNSDGHVTRMLNIPLVSFYLYI